MAFIDDLGNTITRTGQKISQTSQSMAKKMKDMAESSNLKMQVKEEERQLKEVYAEIGEMYCNLHNGDPEEALAEGIQKIEEIKERITVLKEHISKLDNVRVCLNCSAKLPEKGMFCPECGTKYPEPEVVDTDVDAEELKEAKEAEVILEEDAEAESGAETVSEAQPDEEPKQ